MLPRAGVPPGRWTGWGGLEVVAERVKRGKKGKGGGREGEEEGGKEEGGEGEREGRSVS